ncbi:hypothetical protein CPB85DRAFT_976651 [Mucidula mucida]|nr:hypothetical protein CPB85DRAFT_976651 [Mucidula mucida]
MSDGDGPNGDDRVTHWTVRVYTDDVSETMIQQMSIQERDDSRTWYTRGRVDRVIKRLGWYSDDLRGRLSVPYPIAGASSSPSCVQSCRGALDGYFRWMVMVGQRRMGGGDETDGKVSTRASCSSQRLGWCSDDLRATCPTPTLGASSSLSCILAVSSREKWGKLKEAQERVVQVSRPGWCSDNLRGWPTPLWGVVKSLVLLLLL